MFPTARAVFKFWLACVKGQSSDLCKSSGINFAKDALNEVAHRLTFKEYPQKVEGL